MQRGDCINQKPNTKILFVCTGNIFRSPSAEYCLKKHLADAGIGGIEASSAGTEADFQEFDPAVLEALSSYGINPKGHVQRRLTQEIVDGAGVVVAMADYHQRFIKENFGIDVPLFNEICLGEKTSVWDVNDVITDWATNRATSEAHIIKTISHIHDSIPSLVSNLEKFTPDSFSRHESKT